MNISPQQQSTIQHHDEHILVVKRDILFAHGTWQGFKSESFEQYIQIIEQHKEFLPRSLMEQDPTYKQIIPYLIFAHNDRYFLMQRKAKATETRLQGKLTLGIGGHIRQEDMNNRDIFDWARREFHEEIHYTDSFTIQPLGILNDDSNAVGQVHVGFVFLLQGNSANISVKEELESGNLATLQECIAQRERMESWSQIVVDELVQYNNLQHKG